MSHPVPLLATSAAPAFPLWTLEGWRSADPVMGIAMLMIVALLASEALSRLARLPRAVGPILVGAVAGPLVLRLLDRTELDPWKPLLDLAVGLLVFELGTRIRPRWLIDNPWLAAKGVAEAGLAAALVTWSLWLLGAAPTSAALAGAVAMATSPVITIVVQHELRARGQVTERLLLLAALNSVLAVLALKAWRVAAAADAPGVDWLPALRDAVVVLSGSTLLGIGAGLLLRHLAGAMRGTSGSAVLQLALLVLASMLATQFTLSPLLALLMAGMVARQRMGHHLRVEPQLGTAGAALTLLLFLSFGLMSNFDNLVNLWPWVLAIVLARLAGKALAVLALARPSGLGWRQSLGLILALQPTSNLAVLLSVGTFGWPAEFPVPDPTVMQALLVATTLMQLTGPWWTQLGLKHVARECPTDARPVPAVPAAPR